MLGCVDLHSHSTASDGTQSPAEVAELAARSGLSAWALTDHDTVAGIAEAQDASRKWKIEFLPGIEISAEFPPPGTLHILGYGIDPGSASLAEATGQLIEARDTRNPKIIAKLRELGVAIAMEEVEAEAGGTVVGRPHIAAVLLRKGYVNSIKQAFDKYLAQGAPAYFDKERLPPSKAMAMIRQAGGIPVLAHPVQLRAQNGAQLDRIVKDLVDVGMGGIEVLHSDHSHADVQACMELAKKYGLLMTGGSDFHGAKKKDIALGDVNGRRVPREYYDRLMEELNKQRQ